MGRLLGIDLGQKRTGIAVTDELQIIAQPLDTIETKLLFPFLFDYFKKETVDKVIIGLPYNLDDTPTDNTERVLKFITRFKRLFPDIPIIEMDETYTSKMAAQAMYMGGYKKKDRQKKENLDKISAAIILQDYMASQS